MDVTRLYPQYNIIKDRRTQVNPISPVNFERRSGKERRNEDRIQLDTGLTRDIFELKSKVSQLQKTEKTEKGGQQNTKGPAFTQNMSKAVQNSIKTDQFIKTIKPAVKESPKEAAKAPSQTGAMAGLIGIVLGGTLLSTVMGVVGVGIALAIGGFMGGKMLRGAIVNHLKNK